MTRRAFSLVELIVVVAIIGVLIGLLIPAVQKVREAANRVRCQSNLRQIGIAIHNYADATGNLPAAKSRSTALGWDTFWTSLYPFLEQDALYRGIHSYGTHSKPWGTLNHIGASTPIPLLICRSDPTVYEDGFSNSGLYHTWATATYAASYWTFATSKRLLPSLAANGWVYVAPEMDTDCLTQPCTLPATYSSQYTLATIPDGTSNTVAVVERSASFSGGDAGWSNVPVAPVDWSWGCKQNWQEAAVWVGPDCSGYQSPPLAPQPGLISPYYPGGYHPGGCNCLLLDGSVRSVGVISQPAWEAAVRPDDGTMLGSEW